MHATYRNYRIYKRARRKFAFKTYLLLFVWLVLALLQWIAINLFEGARDVFKDYYYICFVTFGLSIFLFSIFIFYEKLRFMNGVNFIFSVLIVELQIISLFALVARVYIADLLIFYGICVILLVMFIVIGSILPRNIDLTLDVAIIFILGFIFLIVAIFFLVVKFVVPATSPWTYLVSEFFISTIMLFFVMYHAQTINGSRFAEMRLNDALLGSLILFHDFLIIYWLTFYWQFSHNPFDKLIAGTTKGTTTTVDSDDYEVDTEEDNETEPSADSGGSDDADTTPGSTTPKGTTPDGSKPDEEDYETDAEGSDNADTTPHGTTPHGTTSDDKSPDETSSSLDDASTVETSTDKTSTVETSPEDTSPDDTSPDDTSLDDTSPDDTSTDAKAETEKPLDEEYE